MSYYSYTDKEKIIGCQALHDKTKAEFFIVMGFQRSGTSLLSNILNSCNIHFGTSDELKPASITNTKGFFENKEVSKLSWKYLNQGSYNMDKISNFDFHTNNLVNTIKRLMTVKKMHSVLYKLSLKHPRVGLKLFPIFYYLWKNYLPTHKIVAIYRDPYVSAHSYLNIFWPTKMTFEHSLNCWVQSQKDLLYHLSQNESMLICYDDLVNLDKRDSIIKQIIDFTQDGNIEAIKDIIDHRLNRRSSEGEKIKEFYPRNQEVLEILHKLETLKIK